MTDKPRTWRIQPEPELKAIPVIELEPVLDLLERVLRKLPEPGAERTASEVQAFLREHGRLK